MYFGMCGGGSWPCWLLHPPLIALWFPLLFCYIFISWVLSLQAASFLLHLLVKVALRLVEILRTWMPERCNPLGYKLWIKVWWVWGNGAWIFHLPCLWLRLSQVLMCGIETKLPYPVGLYLVLHSSLISIYTFFMPLFLC